MTAVTVNPVPIPHGSRWENPIFLKELRCSSRRGRFYLLRVAYIAALALYAVGVFSAVERVTYRGSGGGASAMITRMAEIGKTVVLSLSAFQFVAAQLLAVLLMSGAVSGEVQKRTLPSLLTTPIGPFQICLGKVLAGLWQVLLLLLVSVPLLALVRVMGGVPLGYVLEGMALTLSAAFFAGCMSFYFSVGFHRPYVVMIFALIILVIYHMLAGWAWPLVIPFVILRVVEKTWQPKRAWVLYVTQIVLFFVLLGAMSILWIIGQFDRFWPGSPFSPSMAMYDISADLMSPTGRSRGWTVLFNVAFMVFLGSTVLRSAARRIQSASFARPWDYQPVTEMMYEDRTWPAVAPLSDAAVPPLRWYEPLDPPPIPAEPVYGRCERFGSPVIWRDLRGSVASGDLFRIGLVVVPTLVAAFVYLVLITSGAGKDISNHATVLTVELAVAVFFTAVLSALSVSSERQAGTWALLQTTPLSDGEIFRAKAFAVFWPLMPFWCVIVAHLLLSVLIGQIHWAAIFLILPLLAWVNAFVISLGIWLGLRVAKTTAAVAILLVLLAALWIVLPMAINMACGSPKPILYNVGAVVANPVSQAYAIVEGCPGGNTNVWDEIDGRRPGMQLDPEVLVPTVAAALAAMVFYGGASCLLARSAMRRFRRCAFA